MRQPDSPENVGPTGELTGVGIDRVYTCLSMGASLKDAAAHIGVSVSVLRARRRKVPEFALGLRQAIAKGKVYHLNKISKSPAWQASAWVLERRWRRQFGRNLPEEGPTTHPVEIYDWNRLTVAQQRQVIKLLLKALLTRAETPRASEASAPECGAGGGALPAPAAGNDRGGPAAAEPA